MVIFTQKELDKDFYQKLSLSNPYSEYVFKASGKIVHYQIYDTCVKLVIDVVFPHDGVSSQVEATYPTYGENEELLYLLYQAKAFDVDGNISLDLLMKNRFEVCIGKNRESKCFEVQEIIVQEYSFWDLYGSVKNNLSEMCAIGREGEDLRSGKKIEKRGIKNED